MSKPSKTHAVGPYGKPFAGQFAGVIGAGRSGLAAARLLLRIGAKVLISDSRSEKIRGLPRQATLETGGHTDRLLDCNFLVRSPGVPNDLFIIRKARRQKILIWSEMELAARFIRPKHLVAITGTNGKTTTTILTGKLFAAVEGSKTIVGGNIGTPLSALVGRVRNNGSVILEVSSYQLEDIEAFHPTISAILNISPDHLEHHGTLRAYTAAKARIFENQSSQDVCVLNADDPGCHKMARGMRARPLWFSRRHAVDQGIFFKDGELFVRWGKIRDIWPLRLKLPGAHNIENALAAVGIAVAAGIPQPVIQRTVMRFGGVEHRLERVRTLNGVDYVNDSKATNVASTRVALESFDRPLLVIMGGRGKGSPYEPLSSVIRDRAKRLLLIGEDASAIEAALGKVVPVENVQTMANAVLTARQQAVPGDVVLLSPACASFDQFRDYEDRGRHFKTLVRGLR